MRLLNNSVLFASAQADEVSILVLVDAPLEYTGSVTVHGHVQVSILVLVDAPLEFEDLVEEQFIWFAFQSLF